MNNSIEVGMHVLVTRKTELQYYDPRYRQVRVGARGIVDQLSLMGRFLTGHPKASLPSLPSDVIPEDLVRILSAGNRFVRPLPETRLIRSDRLSEQHQTNIYFKMELCRPTGSFKILGSANKMAVEYEHRGSYRASAGTGGNHGIGVAYASVALGLLLPIIFVPEGTPSTYLDAMKQLGAQIETRPTLKDAIVAAKRLELEGDCVFIHPYDDPLVIAGQGVIGLEILKQLPYVTEVVCSVGVEG